MPFKLSTEDELRRLEEIWNTEVEIYYEHGKVNAEALRLLEHFIAAKVLTAHYGPAKDVPPHPLKELEVTRYGAQQYMPDTMLFDPKGTMEIVDANNERRLELGQLWSENNRTVRNHNRKHGISPRRGRAR